MVNQCAKCKFCDPIPGSQTGICRRHPPKIYVSEKGPVSGQPQVILTSGWCGEGEPGLVKLTGTKLPGLQ